jgi:hypothetical protein
MPSAFITVIEQIVREKRPDVDIRSFTAVHSLLIQPHALIVEPFKTDVDFIKSVQSLLDIENVSDQDVDALIANFFLSRDPGDFASGTARVYFTAPVTVVFQTTNLFVADNGSTFSPVVQTTVTQSIMRLQQIGGLYYADVVVKATVAGTASRIGTGQLNDLQGASFSFLRVDNPFPFSGGSDRETNAQLQTRAQEAIAVRDLVSQPGCTTQLTTNFSFIDRIFIAGFLDPEMKRDIFQGVHIGGRADIYIKPSSLLSQQLKITIPNAAGNFVISDAGSAPGNTARPLVFFDDIKLLDGSQNPTGAPLNREETILVPVTPLITTGQYAAPSVAYNATLDQLHLVTVEIAADGKQYLNYAKLSTQGVVQIPFTRISAGSTSISGAFITVNPSNNRAYIFWGEGGTLQAKILDVSGSSLVVFKDTFALVTGSAVGPKIDVAIADDSDLHIVFVQTATAQDGSTQDNPWYARLTASGNIPGLVVPRQLVFNTSGNNRDPSVVTFGSGASLRITVVFTQALLTSSNLSALQLDNNGQFVGSSTPTALTVGFQTHDQPTVRRGPSNTIHIVYRLQGNSVAYQRITSTNLVTFQPETISLTRASTIRELKLTVNSFGQLYPYWAEDSGNFSDIFTVKIDSLGATIGPVQDVTATPYFSLNPNLVIDAIGNIHLIWLDGGLGANKPFYNKRSAQQYHVVVADPNLRYSGQEQLTIVPEIPAANGIAIDLQWSNLLGEVQNFVNNPGNRTVVADMLVRNQIPATATCKVFFGPANGSLTTTAAQQLLIDYLNAFEGGSLEVAALISLLIQNGATSVTPFTVTVKIDQIDGTIQTITSGDTIQIPRGVFLVAQNVTASFK